MWRANTLGSSAKGDQYFLKHLLGVDNSVSAEETPEHLRPRDVDWREEAPQGKIDLLLTLDFRMTTTTLHSDVILPAATWYEKHDLSTTDMHPFVNTFNPAISTPGSRGRTGRRGRRSRRSSPNSPAPTSAPAATSSQSPSSTTPPMRSTPRTGGSGTGSSANASRSRG